MREILAFFIKTSQQFLSADLQKFIPEDIAALEHPSVKGSFNRTPPSSQWKILCRSQPGPELIGTEFDRIIEFVKIIIRISWIFQRNHFIVLLEFFGTDSGDQFQFNLAISNIAGGELVYNLNGASGQTIRVLSMKYGTDLFAEYPHTIAAINQYFTNYTLTETSTTDPGTLSGLLVGKNVLLIPCLLYTSPSPRDRTRSRMPSSA